MRRHVWDSLMKDLGEPAIALRTLMLRKTPWGVGREFERSTGTFFYQLTRIFCECSS